MKLQTVTIAIALSLSLHAHATLSTVMLKDKKAEAVIASLLISGAQAQVRGSDRSLEIDELSTVLGIGQHECDDDGALCGFVVPGKIHSASQHGTPIELNEQVQLYKTLVQIVDPVFAGHKIDNTDGGMGRFYSEYGQIKCSWKLVDSKGYTVNNAKCAFTIPVDL